MRRRCRPCWRRTCLAWGHSNEVDPRCDGVAPSRRCGVPVVRLLVCDDAPQFTLITEELALCWVHEGRHYRS